MRIKTAVVATALCAFSGAAEAQKLTMEQCFALATEHSLTLKAAEARTQQTRIMQGTAWDVDKTELSLSQDPTSGGSPDNALAISQSIDFPTVYAARRSRLKAETAVEESRQRLAGQQVRADIAAAYCQTVFQQERLRIMQRQLSLLQRYATTAEARYKAGETRQTEALSARRMLEELRLEMVSAESECDAQQLLLTTLVGATERITPADTALTPLSYAPTAYAFASTADGELASRTVTAADKAVREAKNGFAPSLSLALKQQMVISGWDPYHENRQRYAGGNFMGFEVGVGIPLFFGATKAKVKAARKEREAASLMMQQEEKQKLAEHNIAMSRYSAAARRMAYYEQEGSADALTTARLATAEYANGDISYMEYNAAMQEALDTQMKRAAAINDYNQAVVALRRLKSDF